MRRLRRYHENESLDRQAREGPQRFDKHSPQEKSQVTAPSHGVSPTPKATEDDWASAAAMLLLIVVAMLLLLQLARFV